MLSDDSTWKGNFIITSPRDISSLLSTFFIDFFNRVNKLKVNTSKYKIIIFSIR